MSEIPRPETGLATPEQAKDLLTWVEGITSSSRGKQYGHCDGFGNLEIEAAPPEVAVHFPTPDLLCKRVSYSLYATREKDHETHQPRTEGCLANVMFSQAEYIDEGLIYATRLNYHVVASEGGQLDLERHVAHTEHGPHKAAQKSEEQARPLLERIFSGLLEATDELRRLDEARPVEKASGLLDVGNHEAQEIIDFCREL